MDTTDTTALTDIDTDFHEEGGHSDDDGCVIYYTGYQIRRLEGDEVENVDVEDVNENDTVQDLAFDEVHQWFTVVKCFTNSHAEVHLSITALV